MGNRDIIVIGGSSGATAALKAILGALPERLPAAVFIVLHIPARSLGLLATVTAAAANLPVHAATEGMTIVPGNIYLDVPDHHLIVEKGSIRLGRGPRENMASPSIDPLFRSAAAVYGPRVVGVLLSGLLNDGVSGLAAIKRCGGVAVVQDPADEMPRSAMAAFDVDISMPSERIGDVLSDLVNEAAGPHPPVPADHQRERLETALVEFDEGPSTVKEGFLGFVGNVMALGHTPAQDEILKNTFANEAFEHFEIAAYRSLLVFAETVGHSAGMSAFRVSLGEEERMAQRVAELVQPTTQNTFRYRWPAVRPTAEEGASNARA